MTDLFGTAPRASGRRDHRVSVLVPVAVDAPYTYASDRALAPGTVVAVPLGTREVLGCVWDDPPDETIGHNRIREVSRIFDCPPIADDLRRFVDWVAAWTLGTRGMILRMVLRVPDALEPEPPIKAVRATGTAPERRTDARARVLEMMSDGMAWSKSGLATAAGVSPSVVDGLVAQGCLEAVLIPPSTAYAVPDPEARPPKLFDAQRHAADSLVTAVAADRFSVSLLDGVTGSGKTEVFLEAVAETVRRGRQSLILMPEISLTNVVIDRIERRFAARPAEWHSAVPPRQRARVWRGVAEGRVPIVVGARSALFLPFADLGLVIVDEEHDPAYKQEDRVSYHARDMAIVRGREGGFPVILSSATPSIESRVNADQGRYRRLHLPTRIAGSEMPEVTAIDMRRDGPEQGQWISPRLASAAERVLADGRQVLFFLNRRGYAPLTLCRTCGHRFVCPNCSTWLVDHRLRGRLECHHCGHSEKRPEACPECGDLDSLVACGPGVERIAEEVRARHPDSRILVLSSDLPGGSDRLRRELQLVADGGVDIIVGTQLVAKGHTFPNLALVGVVDADLGLANGDPRAAERTFQLLTQVTGRAGRTGGTGEGMLQTYAPEHPVIKALVSGDREAFYREEVAARRNAGLPPFGRLAAIVVSGPDKHEAESYARALARAAPRSDAVEVLGPAEAALAVLRGRYRFRLLARAPRSVDLQAYLRDWLAAGPRPRGALKCMVDVDPQSFL
ncbi:primosomal protein N' [Amorphus orientalis]|uniref:Replication restart protein PriA n=1 Tax=Amorphus orientalis TaxID=649198 RepID=A0AAE3VKV4_9HYPH|nr:primosomal protein N' [Amorphus orientalis]MDQ0313877.1 primosomal protein N' (replication factor Y) [Amorphus orientalis]